MTIFYEENYSRQREKVREILLGVHQQELARPALKLEGVFWLALGKRPPNRAKWGVA